MADNVIEEEGRDKQGSSCEEQKWERGWFFGSGRLSLKNRAYKAGIWRLDDAGDRKNRRETNKRKQTI